MAKDERFAGIDIGGTKLYAVVTDAAGKILGSDRKKTKPEKGVESVLERAAECVAEACKDAGLSMDTLTAVGVGAPSPILPDGTAVCAPNMGWERVPLVKILRKSLGVPVHAENDCNVGTLGEYALGAGRGSKSLVGLFMGTGLGGGIVLHDTLIDGENRMAAEVGHMVVVADGRPCGCGKRGCLEAYASKTGMGYRFRREILLERRPSLLQELSPEGFDNVKSSILAKAWSSKDAVAVETLKEAARFLGIGVGNMITLLGPDTIVLGGGVFEALGKELLPLVCKGAEAVCHPPASYKDTKIVLAALGDDAVALGAVVYAQQQCRKQAAQ